MHRSLVLYVLLATGCSQEAPPSSVAGSAAMPSGSQAAPTTAMPAGPAPVAGHDASTARIDELAADAAIQVAGPAGPPDAAAAPDASSARADRDRALREEAARYAAVLTAEGPSDDAIGDMSKRKPGSDLGAQIDAVRESNRVQIGGGAGRGTRGDPRMGQGGGPAVGRSVGPQGTDGPAPLDKAVTGRVSLTSKRVFDDTTLTADVIAAKIMSAYVPGVKRCYTHELKTDPSTRGKLVVRFTVTERGRTSSVSAKGFAQKVDDCVKNMMSAWSFPIPKDSDNEPTSVEAEIAFAMIPQ